jgi:hypothetical protein
VQLLEQEGVILRVPGDIPGEQSIIAVFDALGGHLAADALLAKHGRVGFVPWLEAPTTQQALLGHTVNTHPLAVDIFRALVGLLPRRLRDQQLWQVIGESYRNAALRQAAALEAAFLDEATISALADYILQGGSAAARLLARLRTASSAERHPLNAEFTDAVLRKMSLPDRDHLWTEWIRENCDQVYEDVGRWRARWQISPRRTPTDRLRAIWVSWSLTTTIRKLRNGATEALYWYGREDPDSLFTITRAAAEIDDLYVFERTLAASYGVAMVIYADVPRNDARRNILKSLARWLFDAMFETDAPYRTTHEMTRDYASRIVELVAHIDRKTFDRDQLARVRGPYSDGGRVPWPELEPGSERMYGLESPFRMDFQNYTLGQLIPDRNNYDFENARYRDVREKVLWRIKALGWSKDRFEKIDHAIESTGMYPTQVVEKRGRIDRYGKKYSWIAYFEIRGWLRDQGRLPNDYEQEPYTYRDIDPSFPRSRIEQRVLLRDVLGRPDISTSHWVKNSRALDLSPELRLPSIMGEHGPWVALNGYVACQDEVRGRRIFAFARAYLISKEDANKCSTLIKGQAEWERAFPDEIASYHTFAGEVPWCSTSPKSERVNLRFTVRETPVKVKRKRAVIYVDGKPLGALSDRILDRLAAEPAKASNPSSGSEKSKELQISVREVTEEFMEIRREEYKIKAIVPVFGYSWTHEQSDGVPIHGTVLATRLSRLGGLINIPQTLDFQTRGGVRATYGLEYQRDDFVNTERWCFIRESILDSLLKRLGLTVVWVVHGERELSVNLRKHGVPDASIADPPYARFHKFHRR